MQLLALELEVDDPIVRHHVVTTLRSRQPPLFVLNTCQRLECWGLEEPVIEGVRVRRHESPVASFVRLVRIAAGLDSRILGELEILGQVRASYKQFREDGGSAHSRLDRIFQDALSLAREARRESGIDSNLTSLGALASRELMARVPDHAPVAVVGSGSLAASVVRYLGKRGSYPIRVSSRCPENALSLAMEVGGFGAGLDDLSHLLDGVEGIVTATAAPHAVLYPHHLAGVKKPLTVIDLSVPADCSPEVPGMEGVTYIPLLDIEEKAQVNSEDRRKRAAIAEQIIQEGAEAWAKKQR